ncbi:MAG: PIN domain-containing protein [Acidobacteriota bacterium]
MNLTIDASVFVAASRAPEANHTVSLDFLRRVEEQEANIFCPTLALAECAAAIARRTDREDLAEELITFIENFPNLYLVSLDATLAHRASEIAITHRIRGADSIYVAVAESANAELITWDDEMLQRGRNLVSTLTPVEWIDNQ